ncbi:MAG: efflux RND transporter periplasmic adaptor subunit [Patescibacteria group bacterium]|nr:efflux RND transporter periplasmic adaptor subunit [Patescibacteria group bacterium]MDE2116499.1 efflux RND transporter periplasmic adaptor subunit [Patescibacteria group bacterium]
MNFLKKHKIAVIVAVVVLVLLYLIFGRGKAAPKFETATAVVGNVVQTVSVTGTVSPVDKADLAFEKGGVVSRIYVAVGDHVNAGDPIAKIDDAADAASYESAQATLADMARGLRPEELAVQESAVAVAETSLSNAKTDAINAAHDAYAKAQSALVTYTDALFNNPSSVNPTITVPTQTYSLQASIDQERTNVTQALSDWSADLAQASTSDAETLITASRTHLAVVKQFMTDLSAIVGWLTTANSGYSQTTINGYTTAVNSALATVNTAADSLATADSSLTTASSGLDQAQSNYSLKLAGNSSESIAAEQAKVDQAAALLAQDTIKSPIDGIVTAVTPSEGEFVAAGSTQFTVQSDGTYKIEAYVPEADIAKVAIGDLASTTLDAYGSNTYFQAKVALIDPAETVIEGVPTYKVTLYFTQKDSRIRSGMTANLDILTDERDNVVSVPYRAVVTDDTGASVVRVVSPNGTSYATTTVATGLKGSDGTVEIISGLKSGDKVVTYVK